MNAKTCILAGLCLCIHAKALAAPPHALATTDDTASGATTAQRPRPCQHLGAADRTIWPNGSMLWGTQRDLAAEEMSSVLVSVDLGSAKRAQMVPGARLTIAGGQLVLADTSHEPTAGVSALAVPGAELQGTASNGRSVDVAICKAAPSDTDPDLVWYSIEYWNERTSSWENPCAGTAKVQAPRALAVQGVWNTTGARQQVVGKFTFACETGAIAKCVGAGYKPWQTKQGRSLADYHQACTRMMRADYCGNGKSHTQGGPTIDVYDTLGVLTAEEPAQSSFEAAWTPEGAYCLGHTRHGEDLKTIRQECPERWVESPGALGQGDRCVMRQKGRPSTQVLMRNRSSTIESQPSGPQSDKQPQAAAQR